MPTTPTTATAPTPTRIRVRPRYSAPLPTTTPPTARRHKAPAPPPAAPINWPDVALRTLAAFLATALALTCLAAVVWGTVRLGHDYARVVRDRANACSTTDGPVIPLHDGGLWSRDR
jgi:hypothetical protein